MRILSVTPSPNPTPSPPFADRPACAALPATPTVLLALGMLVLASCSTDPERETPQAMPQTSARSLDQGTAPRQAEVRPTYRGPWEDPSNPLYNRIVYFDYDSSTIKPEYIGVMRNHAAYLGTNAGTRVTLDGNTDERGTREYNLALGDQRADAVRKFMVAEGVSPGQVATLSYGEERPANPGHSEAAWGQNRRVVIQY